MAEIVVTDETVDKANRAYWEVFQSDRLIGMNDADSEESIAMRAALEAAAPLLQVQGEEPWLLIHHLRVVREAGYVVTVPGDRDAQIDAAARAIHRWDKKPGTWSSLTPDEQSQYRSEAEAVINALPAAAPEVVQVDREALAKAVIAPYELRELLAAHPVEPLRKMAVIGVLEHYNFSVWQPKTYEIADAIIAALSTSGEVEK